ncbi:MAG TPA: ABC transporter substrate-binding protein [Acidimicrobiales bacterium]|jgi:ABC-type branched-subunit amino acid transport system substrate-binding protein|nr:ABC transporter substrate-binding protein [Acidimicrobiales bacterium]
MFKVAAILVAMMLVSAGCGARLTKAQLAKASAGGGQNSSGSALGVDASGAAAGDQAAGTAGGASAAGGGTAGGATAGGQNKATGSGSAAQGAASSCGASGGNADVGVTANSITLANVSLLTGPVPGLFKGAKDGTQAFFNYQNSLGGVCGRKLQLDPRDDQFDANQNKSQYQDAIGKDFGFVGSFSVVDEGGASVLAAHPDVPDVAYALSHAHFNLPNNFSPQPLPPGWRLGSLNYFKAKFGPDVISHMALLVEDAQSAKDAADGEEKAAKSVGYNFVYSRVIEPTEANFTSDVVAMQQKGVKGIMMTGEVGAFVRVAKAMKQQNFTVPFANWGANAYDPAFVTSDAAPATNGSIIDQQLAMFGGEDNLPEVQLFNKWLKQVGGKPDIFAAFGWESARLFVQALTAAGAKPTRASVMAQLKQIDNFDGNGMLAPAGPASKRPPNCFIVINVQNGKFVRADPPSGYICNQGDYFKA